MLHRGSSVSFGVNVIESIADWLKKDIFVRNQVENYQTKVLSIDALANVNKRATIDKEMFEKAVSGIPNFTLADDTEPLARRPADQEIECTDI